jgi:uncharacterized protein YegP (UPF0339 family)
MKIRYWKAYNKQWWFHVVAANGEIIAQSEGYKNKRDCIKTIKLFNLPYELREDSTLEK